MRFDKKEIETILNNAEQILINQPVLASMNLKDVIDTLDSTKEMIRDRWGVAALLVVKSIERWDLPDLVEQLSLVESGDLTCEYVGYLLQTRYGIDMEALLLEADKQNKFDSIVKYVEPNLMFLTKIKQQYISPFLQMLENHIDSNVYYSVVNNYAESIAACDAFLTTTNSLGELKGRVQYDLIFHLGRAWYCKDSTEANRTMECFMEHKSIWSKKAAINFLGNSLDSDKTTFELHFFKIEEMILQDDELWLQIIAVFVKYVMLYSEEADTDHFYGKVMEYLKRLPTDSTKAKCNFLATIRFEKEVPQDIQDVFQAIILNPFENNQCPLQILDHILYRQNKNNSFDNTMKHMLEIFRINGYCYRYTAFFNGLSMIVNELSKNSEKVFRAALKYMLTNDIPQVLFGLGWLMIIGVIYNKETNDLKFSNNQLIRILKASLYCSVDNLKICNIAFQLLDFLDGAPEKYIDFCMDDAYRSYPETMFEVSKQYITAKNASQVQLAELVTKAHEKMLYEHELCLKINDLQPSSEHQYIYRRALQEQNKQINKKAHEQSVFANLFNSITLKYGTRSAHIIQGAKGEKLYQSAPYQCFKQEMELPGLYVDDPVGFAMKRQAFFDEVINSAADN